MGVASEGRPREFRVALAGCGRIAGALDAPRSSGAVSTHAQAFHRHPAFSIEAVCDPAAERCTSFRETWKVPRAYDSLGALLAAERPDVVSVCSATREHYAHVRALLAARSVRVVFVEKPVCEDPEQLSELEILAAARPDLTVLVNHTRRFDPAHRRAAELIRRGALGSLVEGRCDYYGGWLNNGSHLVDTLRMLVGPVTVEEVRAGAPGRPGDPTPHVRLEAGGVPIQAFGFDESRYQLFEIDLRFSEGRVALRNFGESIEIARASANAIGERFLAPLEGSPLRGLDSPLFHAVTAIADHLAGRSLLDATGATLREAAQTMGVLWQAAVRR